MFAYAGPSAAPVASTRKSGRQRKPPLPSPEAAEAASRLKAGHGVLRTEVTDSMVQQMGAYLEASQAQKEFDRMMAAEGAGYGVEVEKKDGSKEKEEAEEAVEEEESKTEEEEEEEEGGGEAFLVRPPKKTKKTKEQKRKAKEKLRELKVAAAAARREMKQRKLSKAAQKARENDAEYWGALSADDYEQQSGEVRRKLKAASGYHLCMRSVIPLSHPKALLPFPPTRSCSRRTTRTRRSKCPRTGATSSS